MDRWETRWSKQSFFSTVSSGGANTVSGGDALLLPLIGGMAQWLGRWSLAGGLSLIYAWSMVEMCPLRG